MSRGDKMLPSALQGSDEKPEQARAGQAGTTHVVHPFLQHQGCMHQVLLCGSNV